jgi:hypothetical protein
VTGLQPAGHPRAPRSTPWATIASAHRSRARRVGAAARGMAGLRPNRDSMLGCAGHQRAARGLSRASARSGTLVARSAARGGAHDPCRRRRSTSAGSLGHRTATASTRTWKVQVLRAVAGILKRTWLACDLDQNVLWCVATAVLAHARPRHARSVQPSGGQRRSSRRGGGAPINPCTRNHGTMAGPKHFPRTATAAPKSTNGLGAPSVAVR